VRRPVAPHSAGCEKLPPARGRDLLPRLRALRNRCFSDRPQVAGNLHLFVARLPRRGRAHSAGLGQNRSCFPPVAQRMTLQGSGQALVPGQERSSRTQPRNGREAPVWALPAPGPALKTHLDPWRAVGEPQPIRPAPRVSKIGAYYGCRAAVSPFRGQRPCDPEVRRSCRSPDWRGALAAGVRVTRAQRALRLAQAPPEAVPPQRQSGCPPSTRFPPVHSCLAG
jgi:hypothetical protein